jgi:hypothetical protein
MYVHDVRAVDPESMAAVHFSIITLLGLANDKVD